MRIVRFAYLTGFLLGHVLSAPRTFGRFRQHDEIHHQLAQPGSSGEWRIAEQSVLGRIPLRPHLARREAKHKGNPRNNGRPASQPRPKQQPKPLNPKQQAANARKAQQNAANAEKKAKGQAAKAEKQKQKDQKHVQDNLNRERKAQDRAGQDAMKNLSKVEKGTAKDRAREDRRYSGDQQKLKKNLANSERQLAREKGKKGFGNAQKKLNQAKAAMENAPAQHKARIDKVYASSNNALNRDRAKLDKSLAKAHSNEFDPNGRAKDHPSALQKFGKVMSYLGPALLSVIPGVGAPMLGAMAGARIASLAIQTGAKEGGKQGIKQGTKQGIKKGKKNTPGGSDYKVQTQQQIKTSQKNKDAKIDAFEQQRKKFVGTLRHPKRDLIGNGRDGAGFSESAIRWILRDSLKQAESHSSSISYSVLTQEELDDFIWAE